MKKFFIFVIVVIVIIGLYFIIEKPSAQPQSKIDSQTENVQNNTEKMSSAENVSKIVVNYTDDGFSPSSVEIKVGDTVQFVNQSSGGMWVASGPHPSHTAYPEFDAKKNIPSGGTYEFTFTKIGEWKYHNHAKAGMYGTILVK